MPEQVDLGEVRAWIADRPFMTWMGIAVVTLEPRNVVLSLNIEPHMRYIQGMLHGGLACVLLDTAIGVAARLEVPADRAVRTTALETHYLAPGRGSLARVVGTATLADDGSGNRVVGTGTVSIDGIDVASGRGEFAVVYRDRNLREAHGRESRRSVAGG
ncbi:PaaI family thioesterase [Sporichthya polymorpha]|uniref:PaaI family thioesterase n=1 Tax=Sporichthya polymorpha TaxID=35751 RepID=UPI0012EB103D|nr:PaaI family thioesterase [Sporichthya polymorpha]